MLALRAEREIVRDPRPIEEAEPRLSISFRIWRAIMLLLFGELQAIGKSRAQLADGHGGDVRECSCRRW